MARPTSRPTARPAAGLSRFAQFALLAFGGLVLGTLVWSQIAPWAAYPAGLLAKLGLEYGAAGWVRSAQVGLQGMVVDTSVAVANTQTGGRLAEITLESPTGRYAYSLPILLALLWAARGPGRLWRSLAGYALLLPLQAFSLVFHLLMQVQMTAQFDPRVLKISTLQMELITYAYQLGVLVVPTLSPILLWLWLDRRFVDEVVVQAWRRGLAPDPRAGLPADAAPPAEAAPTPPAPVASAAVPGSDAQAVPAAAPADAPGAAPAPPPAPPAVPLSRSASAALPERPRRSATPPR